MRSLLLSLCLVSLVYPTSARAASADQPASRAEKSIEGFRVRIDDRLLPGGADDELGRAALAFLAAKLVDVGLVQQPKQQVVVAKQVVRPQRLHQALKLLQRRRRGRLALAQGKLLRVQVKPGNIAQV